jgi:hypothetical protein
MYFEAIRSQFHFNLYFEAIISQFFSICILRHNFTREITIAQCHQMTHFYLFSCTSWLNRMHNPSACFLLPYSSFLLPSTSVLVCTVSPVLYIQYLHKNRTKIGCHRFWYWPKLVLHHSKLMQEICEIVPWFHLQCNTAFRINENHQFILPRGAHKKL